MIRARFDVGGIHSWWSKNPEKSGHVTYHIWIECTLTEKEIKGFFYKKNDFVFFLSSLPLLGICEHCTLPDCHRD